MENKLYIGTSGFNYRDWKGRLYPEGLPQKEWLSYYAARYNSVEINNSFYTSVKEETYEKWYQQTPADFRFVIKGHRYITQYKKMHEVEEPVRLFFDGISHLKEKVSCILWQFPKQFTLNREVLVSFVEILPKTMRHAFEFRDDSWFTPDVSELLGYHNATLVVADSSIFPQAPIFTNAPFTYIRFHGPTTLYSSGYSHEALQEWAEKIKQVLQTQDVYVYFNNDAAGHALKNVNTLKDLC